MKGEGGWFIVPAAFSCARAAQSFFSAPVLSGPGLCLVTVGVFRGNLTRWFGRLSTTPFRLGRRPVSCPR